MPSASEDQLRSHSDLDQSGSILIPQMTPVIRELALCWQ